MVAKRMTRDERQALSMQRWIAQNGVGCIVSSTAYGKTRVATNIINWLQEKHPDIRILVVVPTTALQEQWNSVLTERGCLKEHINVLVINTVIRNTYDCDLLILDECHRYPAETFSDVFKVVKYKMILCLTATLERLDGKHVLIERYAPVCDTVTVQECLANGWISNYKEYAVIIEPADLSEYEKLTKEFTEHFEFFDYDFALAMSMIGPNGWKHRTAYAKQICQNNALYQETLKGVTAHAFSLMRAIQARKKYIYDHPEKLRVAEEIISYRSDCKIITFSASVAAAERFKEGFVCTGKTSKKKNRATLEEFSKMPSGCLHSCRLLREGFDAPDISVGIALGIDSSHCNRTQSRGRVVRYQEGKEAEFFTLILKDTVEVEWWKKSTGDDPVTVIDEENLMKVLRHEPFETYKEPLKQFSSRV